MIRADQRRQVLAAFGVPEYLRDSLLHWTGALVPLTAAQLPVLPLPDLSSASFWRMAAAQSPPLSSTALLASCFPALEDEHEWEAAESMKLDFPETPAGTVPVFTIPSRKDFLRALRALAWKTPPAHIPDSLGAMFIANAPNRRLRLHLEREYKALPVPEELCRDQIVLLSAGPYAALQPGDVRMSPEDWLGVSLHLRRTHELFHFVLRRLRGKVSRSLTEELLADFAACRAAAPEQAEWLLPRVLHLHSAQNQRWMNYLPDALRSAAAPLGEMLRCASQNLFRLALPEEPRLIFPLLAQITLEDLCSAPDQVERLVIFLRSGLEARLQPAG